MKSKSYTFKFGKIYDISNIEIPKEWSGEIFDGEPEDDVKKYEPWTHYKCIKTCKLKIILIE
jgi:hypothetical protein